MPNHDYDSLIKLKRLYKTRAGWGVWRWLHVQTCSKCKAEHRILGNNTKQRPSLPPGAIKCSTSGCDGLVKF